jgi:hypothetical protein
MEKPFVLCVVKRFQFLKKFLISNDIMDQKMFIHLKFFFLF